MTADGDPLWSVIFEKVYSVYTLTFLTRKKEKKRREKRPKEKNQQLIDLGYITTNILRGLVIPDYIVPVIVCDWYQATQLSLHETTQL